MAEKIWRQRRAAVAELCRAGLGASDIFKQLKKTGVTDRWVRKVVKRFAETSSISPKKRSGRPRCARTPRLLKNLGSRIDRMPLRSQRKLADSMEASPMTINRALKEDLGHKAFKRRRVQLLDDKQKRKRFLRSKALLTRLAGENLKKVVWSDETPFSLQNYENAQHLRVYGRDWSSIDAKHKLIKRSQFPGMVMFWFGVSWYGKMEPIVVPSGTKVKAQVYIRDVLEQRLKRPPEAVCPTGDWIFQQDGATSHTANCTQAWLKENVPDFLRKDEWPPNSPDLAVLDFGINAWLKQNLGDYSKLSRNGLIDRVKKLWAKMPMSVVRDSIGAVPRRLKLCVRAKGNTFERK